MTHITIERDKLEQALEALFPISHNTTDDPRGQAGKAIKALEEALAKQSAERVEQGDIESLTAALEKANALAEHFKRIGYLRWDELEELKQEQVEPDDLTIAYMCGMHRGKKLAQQRKPLTDEQIKEGWRKLPIQIPMGLTAYLPGARFAEAAHGIGGQA